MYSELTAAVLALDTSDLKDAAATFAHDEETARLAREPASPTKVLRDALAATHLQTPISSITPLPYLCRTTVADSQNQQFHLRARKTF